MKTLTQYHDAITKVYSRLNDLINTAIFKAYRSSERYVDSEVKNYLPKTNSKEIAIALQKEEEFDRIAYNDSINKRFELYHVLTFKYLGLYLKEYYGMTSRTHKKTIDMCLSYGIINEGEASDLNQSMKYIRSINTPCNIEGDYLFTDKLISYIDILSSITSKLNPKIKYSKTFKVNLNIRSQTQYSGIMPLLNK